FINQSIDYTFRAGVPISLRQWASPYVAHSRLRSTGMYVQDQWTISKVTLNLGLRYDYFNGYNLADDLPAGRFVPARHFDAVHNVPNWSDLSPRLGGAYDAFGNG